MTDFLVGRVVLHHGDSREVLKGIADESIDAVVTDPPYALTSIVKRFGADGSKAATVGPYTRTGAGFMGQRWDTGEVAFDPAFWADVLRVLRPGGHVLACGGTRTYHRLVCAIEDGGFEIRDSVAWLYGSGFPKSHDIGKALDRAAGAKREVIGDNPNYRPISGVNYDGIYRGANTGAADVTAPATDLARQWSGWGSALKPAAEFICLARKPLIGTIAENVIAHGVGGLNIDGCRVEADGVDLGRNNGARTDGTSYVVQREAMRIDNSGGLGRWPANVVHDGSEEVSGGVCGRGGAQRHGRHSSHEDECKHRHLSGKGSRPVFNYGDSGSAARFFYTAKADADGRAGSSHPTIKPVDLMRWLVRLVMPPGGVVLDPFAGSGTTGEAAFLEGMRAILVEREAGYCADIGRRLELLGEGAEQRALRLAAVREDRRPTPWDEGTLFA